MKFLSHLVFEIWCGTGRRLSWAVPVLVFIYMLWRCWLGGRKGIRPEKNWGVLGCSCSYVSGSKCRHRHPHGPADATAIHYLLLQLEAIQRRSVICRVWPWTSTY